MAGIIPLELFTTPYSDPYGKSSVPTQGGLGDLGKSLTERAQFQQQLTQRKRESEAQNALGHRNASISEAWHREQTEARREIASERAKTAKEKRFSELEVAFRKAKSVQERELIRQEMTRLGFSVEEVDTDLPEVTAPEVTVPEPGIPLPPKGTKVPKVNPKFAAALAAEVGKEDPTGTEAPPSAGAPEPMDWMGLGMPPPADKPAGPAKPKRGGKFLIRDSSGALASSFDEPAEREKGRQAVAAVLEPYIGNPSSPEAKRAAENAQKAAQSALDAGFNTQEAAKFGAQMYDKQMGQFRDQKLPSVVGAGGGGSGGLSAGERIRKGQLSQQTMDFLTKLDTSEKIPEARKALATMDEMDRALATADKEGFAGGNAISSYMKAISGAQVSEQEVHRIFGSAGAQAEWEAKLSPYTNGGKLPPELIAGLKGVVARAKEVFNERINHAVEKGHSTLGHLTNTATPEEKEEQKKAVTSWFRGRDDEPAKGPQSDDAERRDLLKKLEKYK